jgi:hypothetical protein
MTQDEDRSGLGPVVRGCLMFAVGLIVFAVLVFGVCAIVYT